MAASAYHVISTEVENHIFKPIEFLDTSAFINNPHWQSSGILIFLCKYYIVVSHTLVGFFLELQNFMRNQDGKIELHKKVHKRVCVRDITALTARSPFFVFLLLSSSTPSHFPSYALAEWPLQRYIYNYDWYSVWWYHE